MVPSKTKYVGLWLWDSALHALASGTSIPHWRKTNCAAMLAHQLPDGMRRTPSTTKAWSARSGHPIQARVTKPPILAWAAIKLYEQDKDEDFIRRFIHPVPLEYLVVPAKPRYTYRSGAVFPSLLLRVG
jgi:hypothetical protein